MTTGGLVGSVAALWRFPVKSMAGERLDHADLEGGQILGDRAYALIETATGKVVSAKSAKAFPDLLDCRAGFVEAPRPGREMPAVQITLPNGTSVSSESGEAERALSEYYGRDMTLARAAPDDFTIDQYHPDVEGADGAGRRDAVADQKLGSAFFAELGMDSPVPVGAFFDLFPLSVITTSTLDRLQALAPGSRFDPRRFRMNVIVASREAGLIENDWIGHALQIGDAVRLRVALRDPRCVMTTLAQGDLPKDTHVLRALVQHNKVQVGPADKLPCAGVYAVTETSGTIQVGDAVTLD
jgi:hypothetical protein